VTERDAGLITMLRDLEAVMPAESVTCTLMLNVPADVGVLLRVRVSGVNVNPGGALPVSDQLYGEVPPLASTGSF
jgi:hypothetical protein